MLAFLAGAVTGGLLAFLFSAAGRALFQPVTEGSLWLLPGTGPVEISFAQFGDVFVRWARYDGKNGTVSPFTFRFFGRRLTQDEYEAHVWRLKLSKGEPL